MTIHSLDTLVSIDELRAKAVAGTITREEMRAVIKQVRGDRTAAFQPGAVGSRVKKAAKSKAVVDVDDLFGQLDKL